MVSNIESVFYLFIKEIAEKSGDGFTFFFTSADDSTVSYFAIISFSLIVAILLRFNFGYEYAQGTKNQKTKYTYKEIFKTIWPKYLLSSKSFWRDVTIFIVGRPINVICSLLFIGIGSEYYKSLSQPVVYNSLSSMFSNFSMPFSAGFLVDLSYSIALVVAYDFGAYFAHRLLHRVEFLWEFHKFHHSAEVLNVFTRYRFHVVEFLFFSSFGGIMLGLTSGIFQFAFSVEPTVLSIVGFAILDIGFNLGLVLQHSHIWWSFGKLDYVLTSPAMHTIHHSKDPRHFNKNFASYFTVFDVLFGTLYKASRTPEVSAIGIDDIEWTTTPVWKLYLLPFQRNIKRFARFLNGH